MSRLRALVAGVCLVPLVGVTAAAPAVAQPSPTPAPVEVPPAVPGDPVCTITDFRLVQVSGMVATDDGYIVINDQTDFFDRQPIFFLNESCAVVDQQGFFNGTPYDPEDLALDRAGDVLWVGDIGDTEALVGGVDTRQTVALWRVDLAGDRTPVIHRFAYPDGQPRDAETLILDGDGMPIIVTRTIRTAELFKPGGPLQPNNPPEQAVPLEKVGEFTPPDTGSEHVSLPSVAARVTITGGANSPDGSKVVLRTYTDAFEFDVTDGDVVAAITTGTPRVTPLPDEPYGESITYTPDGSRFLTVSDAQDKPDVEVVILQYTPSEPAPEPPPPEDGGAAAPPSGGRSLLDRLGAQGIINIIAGIGVVGLLMVAAGVVGIVRARRGSPDGTDGEDPDDGPDDGHPAGSPVTARAQVRPPEPAQPEWEERPAGVYTSAGYGGGPGHAGGAGYGAPPSGAVYSAGPGYHEHPFDQDHPDGYVDQDYADPEYADPEYADQGYADPGYDRQGYGGQGHGGQGHGGQGHGGQGHGGDQRYAPGPPQPAQHGHPTYAGPDAAGGVYGGRTYQAGEDVPDYYSDDPDYPYEFRQEGTW